MSLAWAAAANRKTDHSKQACHHGLCHENSNDWHTSLQRPFVSCKNIGESSMVNRCFSVHTCCQNARPHEGSNQHENQQTFPSNLREAWIPSCSQRLQFPDIVFVCRAELLSKCGPAEKSVALLPTQRYSAEVPSTLMSYCSRARN